MALDRVEVSRRLKAARALRGVTVAQLAALEQVRVNGITTNLIGETERGDRDARQMELRVIADALDLPAWFFAAGDIGQAPAPSSVDSQLDRIEDQVADFQAWAERAVDRIIQDRTEAIARVDQRLSTLEGRVGEVADAILGARVTPSQIQAAREAAKIAAEAAQRQSGSSRRTRASGQSPGGQAKQK